MESLIKKKVRDIQLNEFKTDPYCLQLSQNMTTDCLLISAFLSILACFTCCKPIIVQKIKTILDSQELVKTLKPTNKWSPSFGLIEKNMEIGNVSN